MAMDAAADVRSSPAGKPCMSPSTIIPVWPSPQLLPDQKAETTIAFLRDAVAFYAQHGIRIRGLLTDNGSSYRSRQFRARLCRARRFGTTSPAPTLHAPMAKPNASSRPPCANGPTPVTGPTPKNATSTCCPGSSTTTSSALMVVSATLHPSAALPQVQRLDKPQAPPSSCFAGKGRPPLDAFISRSTSSRSSPRLHLDGRALGRDALPLATGHLHPGVGPAIMDVRGLARWIG